MQQLDPNKRIVSIIMERLESPNKDTGEEVKKTKLDLMKEFVEEDGQEEEDSKEEEILQEEDCLFACEDIIAALVNKDAKGLHESLQNYMEIAQFIKKARRK